MSTASGKSINIPALYQGFAADAASRGFAKSAPARRTLRDRQTVTVATDVGSASQPLKKSFFTTLNQPNRTIRSQDPKILDGSGIPKDTLIGIFGCSLRLQHAAYAATVLQKTEVIAAIADAVLEIKIGSDVLVELSGYEMLVGDAGYRQEVITTAGTGTIDHGEGFILEWARICTDQANISADLYVNKITWTTTVNFDIFLELMTWIALEGSPVASSAQLARF